VTRKFVLDANAVLHFVEGTGAAPRVNDLLKQSFRRGDAVLISVANWGEVFYSLLVKQGEERARSTLANLLQLPIQLFPIDIEQALKAGEIKARHHLPFVDSLAAALAEMQQAALVTSDRHFEKLGKRIRILWLPRT
jgi:predicted nucleic acid-binding protein